MESKQMNKHKKEMIILWCDRGISQCYSGNHIAIYKCVKSIQWGDVGRRVQTSSYKINKFQGSGTNSMVTIVNNTVLYTWKLLVDLKYSYYEKIVVRSGDGCVN